MVDVLRRYPPALSWLEGVKEERIVLPGFAVMELMAGCDDGEEMRTLREELRPYDVIWPRRGAYDDALALFAEIHLTHGTGIVDTLIGVTAVGLDEALHTFNEKHYGPIPDLRLVQPYRRDS
ncbi:MAG: VapC toxin family PIN domain ribonuclease [Bacteroidetes bacterium QS_8_68_15]|nr:MAG: VapC toxin family PIN domain ribonuclease [Bacteroidetes bacterium QS_8_68_15]